MPFQITIHHGPFLHAVASGEAHLGDLLGGIAMVRAVAAEYGYRRALLDLLGTQPKLSFSEHLRLGEALAASLCQLERVASAVPPQARVGTSEKAARHGGLELRAFTALPAAREWLSEEPDPRGAA